MTENLYETPKSPLDSPAAELPLDRKKLVPLWIKVFGWLFIVMGVTMPFFAAWAHVESAPLVIDLFGLKYGGPVASWGAMLMLGITSFFAISAYGLLFGRRWGLDACLVNGYLGLLIAIGTTILSGGASIRLEPVISFFYLRALHRIRPSWATAESQKETTS